MKETEYLIAFRWTRYNLNVGWGRMVKRCKMSGANLNNVEDEMLSYLNGEADRIVAEGGETLTDNERFMMIKVMHFSELESDSSDLSKQATTRMAGKGKSQKTRKRVERNAESGII